MNKKLLSFFIACIMCLSAVSIYAADENTNSYLREIELVRSLDIMRGYDDGSFGENNNITRMEYTAVIVRLLGHEELSQSYTKSTFTDVESDSWGSGYVALASELGLVDGNGDGTFSPQNDVTFHQAIKIMVSALGYKLNAEAKGGYPSGYLAVAIDLKIVNGLPGTDKALNRGQVAKLIANSLDVKLEDATKYLSTGDYYVQEVPETLLANMGLYKKEGIVTATYGINTTNSKLELAENEIVIGDEHFFTEVSDCSRFILKRVIFYAKNDDAYKDTVYFMQEKAYGNDELIIDAEDISEDATTLYEIKYMRNDKWKTQELPDELVIVYNGKLVASSDYSDSLLKPKSGVVTLIDPDMDRVYEYAVIDEYENYIVDAVILPKIYDKFSKSIDLDEEDKISSVIYYDGVKVSAEEIKTGDVLSVARSLDKKNVKIEISRERTTGYVDAIVTDALGNMSFVIDDTEYVFAENYREEYENSSAELKKLNSGDSAEFYFDVFGKLAYSEPVTIDENGSYGYLINIAASRGFQSTGQIEIMTAENKFEIFDCAEKIAFGRNVGYEYKISRESFSEIYEKVTDDNLVNMQMIKYGVDSEGKISRFFLADKIPFSSNFSLDVSRNSNYYANGVYAEKYILNSNTIWMDIPESGLYTDLFSAGYAPDFLRASSSYTLELYDVEDNVAQAVVCKSNSPRYLTYETKVIIDKVNSPIMLVDKVQHVKMDDYMQLCVSGYVDMEYKTVPVSDEIASNSRLMKGLKKGTIIQYETNYAEIKRAETSEELEVIWVYNILHDFNVTTSGLYRTWDNTYIESNNAGLGTIFGVVTDVSYPYFTVSYEDQYGNQESATLQLGTQTLCYSYNRNTSEWLETNQREVQPSEILFIRTRYNRIREIVILKD